MLTSFKKDEGQVRDLRPHGRVGHYRYVMRALRRGLSPNDAKRKGPKLHFITAESVVLAWVSTAISFQIGMGIIIPICGNPSG